MSLDELAEIIGRLLVRGFSKPDMAPRFLMPPGKVPRP
jgi:hypothetical protein